MNANVKGGFIMAGIAVAVALTGFVLYCFFGLRAPDDAGDGETIVNNQRRFSGEGDRPTTNNEVL